ncbi:MAG: Nif3-like dinuclear metal center hexameric protein, partial [Candidatus Gastranaerophilaceae bacterium]
MDKYEIISKLEKIAPLETQESWDCSGWIVETKQVEINRVMLALTVTDDVIKNAVQKRCDMIISHHPLFFVPIEYKDIDIYASHTPLDKTKNGTTETLIKALGYTEFEAVNDFVRLVRTKINIEELKQKLKLISPKLRMVNNKNVKQVNSVAFCAGSGSEFINSTDADVFVTGDLKYHTAVEANKVLFDIGHFESEILILEVIRDIIGIDVEMSNEKTPF